MRNWLIVYDRPKGALVRCDEYSDSREAIRERFAVERLHQDDATLEIVVLGADSLDTLKITHARYFQNAES